MKHLEITNLLTEFDIYEEQGLIKTGLEKSKIDNLGVREDAGTIYIQRMRLNEEMVREEALR